MDKISKAVRIARAGRKRVGAAAFGQEPSLQKIEYSTTRKDEPDIGLWRRNKILAALDDDAVHDAYKLLRTRVAQRLSQHGWNTIGVTSSVADEGKTLTAINLALSIARTLDHTVLLVDADLRRPSIHKMLGLEPEAGIVDCLEGRATVPEVLVTPGIDRFVVMPGRSGTNASSELLSSPQMAALVRDLKHRYPSRIVLFDLPPVLLGDDVVAFAPLMEAMILVIQDGKATRQGLSKALELLDQTPVLGTVLNRSSSESRGYDYYY